MMAAENGALPGGKVGGIGDVLRDLPPALAARGWQPTVLTPAYGRFNELRGAECIATLPTSFGGAKHAAAVFRLPHRGDGVEHVAIEHPVISSPEPGAIYIDDGPERPFASDATRFAFFCAAAAEWVASLDQKPDVVHLHDWHTAFYFLLRDFTPALAALKKIRTVFTIHNLALQGIRPFDGDESSLSAWFPDREFPLDGLADPRYPDCINPMAVGIRRADKLNTVSPAYAREILRPSDPAEGFVGGEGLEADLRAADADGRLTGILNGAAYPGPPRQTPEWKELIAAARSETARWQEEGAARVHQVANVRLGTFPRRRPRTVLFSIGRLTAQKVALFLEPVENAPTALEAILDELGTNGVLIMLGSGDPALERRIAEIEAGRENFVLLCGYSETLSAMLYLVGDIFLMPSSFEPCGISQLLAMRAGQPVVAHAVGGLKDTIRDGETGFLFDGDSPAEQAAAFVRAVRRARSLHVNDPKAWSAMRERAAAARFDWAGSAERYEAEMYEPD